MSKADIAALLERVRQATGPDREIDYAITELERGPCDFGSGRYAFFPEFTDSLDAIVALIERELPDYRVQLFKKASGGWIARLNSPRYDLAAPHERDHQHPWESPNGALALCAAFLAAKLFLSDHSQT